MFNQSIASYLDLEFQLLIQTVLVRQFVRDSLDNDLQVIAHLLNLRHRGRQLLVLLLQVLVALRQCFGQRLLHRVTDRGLLKLSRQNLRASCQQLKLRTKQNKEGIK